MRITKVQIGATYAVRIGYHNNYKAIRIDGTHPDGGWVGTNISTGRTVHIRSLEKLCWLVEPAPN